MGKKLWTGDTNFQECKYNLLYFFDLHSLGPDGIRGKFDLVPIVEGAFEVWCENSLPYFRHIARIVAIELWANFYFLQQSFRDIFALMWKLVIVPTRVVDPHWFNADPDPVPNPGFLWKKLHVENFFKIFFISEIAI